MNKLMQRQVSQNHFAMRLPSYIAIAAASLLVLAAGQKVNAALMVFDFDPPIVATVDDLAAANPDANQNRNIWINIGDSSILGGGDTNILQFNPQYLTASHKNSDGTAGASSIRVNVAATGTSAVLTPTGSPGNQIRPFAYGAEIGPGLGLLQRTNLNSNNISIPSKQAGISLNGGQFGSGYIGMLVGRAGQTYYGWVEVSTNAPGASIATATITRWAIETTPNTPILAGVTVPEPSSVLLLATSVCALVIKRKKRISC